ncbi:MAG: NADH:ubiquinone oxidoreductase subunit M [Candidatus Binatia bacterium]|nr:MAG: NADH:ubiquinone oxidoreductase subunit M [Candidatus Binatia bacterium]
MPWLTAIVFSPLAGALVLGTLPRSNEDAIRRSAFVFSLVPLVLCLAVAWLFEPGRPDMQFSERAAWIPSFGISYHLGVDGLSLFLLLLTAFLTPLVVLASWSEIRTRVKEFHVLVLLLETGMLGTFLALDLFLFYVFWELMLVPMYLLIGVWGGPRRVYAAVKFVLYTMAGSLLMLVAILYLAWAQARAAGEPSFDLLRLYELALSPAEQRWLFAAFALAFAIKVPVFPLHTWLPDAHVEAPTGGSVILAGVLLKMGTYGLLRFALPLFPLASTEAAPYLALLGTVGIVYGALVAMVQPDLKKLVAYSSVSHLGFVVLGLCSFNAQATAGAVYQMLGHGLSTGALFLLVGVLYERRHTRQIADFGGLWKVVPVYASFLLVITLASVGLPGLNGFVGEFLILLGAFAEHRVLAVLATSGVVLGAAYMLWMYQRVAFGPISHPENRELRDLTKRELATLAPILLLCFALGVYPAPLLERMGPSIELHLTRMRDKVERTLPHAPRPATEHEPSSVGPS